MVYEFYYGIKWNNNISATILRREYGKKARNGRGSAGQGKHRR